MEDLSISACSSIIHVSLTMIDTTANKKVKNIPIKRVVAAVHHDMCALFLYLRFLVTKIHPTMIMDKIWRTKEIEYRATLPAKTGIIIQSAKPACKLRCC